ncbi:hypothetical protein BS47DRAFT_1402795 [Hydnum rufescens UP504]|uniref:Uncharacterized protein n=1 Tax=Hydnum rufescens UP504 TaxID=1448309 RepID=A0A9P6ACG1_9AGAM|nr:hypothetical protein BS47DRAFT_1402795 [Hydnum rufescens UP504]
MEPTSTSGTHAQPSTLAANRSELSRLSGPDTVPCQHSQDGAPDSEPASNLALRSGQSCTSNQEYSGSSPMTWSKDGDAEAAPVDAAWSDLFDNREKLENVFKKPTLNMNHLVDAASACCYLQKEWSLVFTSSQRHFQYFGVSSTLHPPVRQAGSWIQLDPPSYTPAMNVQNNGVKTILPYYQSLFTKFFSSCHCALEHWSSVARYLKVPDVPLPPTKPTSLGRSTSLEFGMLNTAVYRLPLTPADRQAVDDLVRMGTPVFGVVEYLHRDRRDTVPDRCPTLPKAAAAAAPNILLQ